MEFVSNASLWIMDKPPLATDLTDPLLNRSISYGTFMLGFDFHVTEHGPKLIGMLMRVIVVAEQNVC